MVELIEIEEEWTALLRLALLPRDAHSELLALGVLVGSIALANLLSRDGLLAASGPVIHPARPYAPRAPHFPAKAKNVVVIFCAGAVSQLETWDYKPKLAKMHGEPMPESFTKGKQIAQLQNAKLNCYGPQLGFKKFDVNRDGFVTREEYIANGAKKLKTPQ